MPYLSRYREVITAAVILFILVVPVTGSRLWLYNMLIVAVFAIATIGLAIVTGRAGQVTFAQTSFMAVGGYGLAILSTRYHWNPWLAVLGSAVVAAVAALLIGFPLLRLRGHYLAMATFALALGTSSFANAATGLTNGALGMPGVPPLSIGPFTTLDQTNAYAIAWALVALSLAVYFTLTRSFVGRAWRAIALREDVAASLGVNLAGYKMLAFVVAAILASVAGSLYAAITSFVSPDIYDASTAINLFVVLFIGGRGAMFGPVLGSILLIFGPQAVAGISAWQNIIFLTALLLVIMFLPEGILGGGRGLPSLRRFLPAALRPKAEVLSEREVDAREAEARRQRERRPAVLEAAEVAKRFGGVTAIKRASVVVHEGRVTGLIGPNGAGKSTLLSILSGFVRPDGGSVVFDGENVSVRGPAVMARRGLIRTFQEGAPIRGLSALDNVLVGMHTRFRGGPLAALVRTPGMRRQEKALRAEARALLQEIGLGDVADVDAARLTFGQLRFLEIARALGASPQLLLLDEPTAGLNKVESDRLTALVRRMQVQGAGLMIVDHNVPFLFAICERVTVMNYGEVIAEGPPAEIEQDTAVRAAYLGTEEGLMEARGST